MQMANERTRMPDELDDLLLFDHIPVEINAGIENERNDQRPPLPAVSFNVDYGDAAAVDAELARCGAIPGDSNLSFVSHEHRLALGIYETPQVQMLKYMQHEDQQLRHAGETRKMILTRGRNDIAYKHDQTQAYLSHLSMVDPMLLTPSPAIRRAQIAKIMELEDPEGPETLLFAKEEYVCRSCFETFPSKGRFHLHLTSKQHRAVFSGCQVMCETCKVPISWGVRQHLWGARHRELRYLVFTDELFLQMFD
jgi:hypothetical protein